MRPIDSLLLASWKGEFNQRDGEVYATGQWYAQQRRALGRAIAAYEHDEATLAFVLMTDSNISATQRERILRRWQEQRRSHLDRGEADVR